MEPATTKSPQRYGRARVSSGTPQSQASSLEPQRTTPPKSAVSASRPEAYQTKRASPYMALTSEVILQHEEATDQLDLQSSQQDHITRLNTGLDALGVDTPSPLHQRVWQDQLGMSPTGGFQAGPHRLCQQHMMSHHSGEVHDPGTSPNEAYTQGPDAFPVDGFDSSSDNQWAGNDSVGRYQLSQDYTQDFAYYVPEQEYYPQELGREDSIAGIGEQFDSNEQECDIPLMVMGYEIGSE